ncbi:MAG: hypothetical protein K2I18_07585 [Paramuribaculum sp.]|nr:hypothetical protein [Paramuribaculum sp.]
MEYLFYIGIVLLFLSFIPQMMLAGRITRERKEFERMPLKLNEAMAKYRRLRIYLWLFQMGCIILAIIGVFA